MEQPFAPHAAEISADATNARNVGKSGVVAWGGGKLVSGNIQCLLLLNCVHTDRRKGDFNLGLQHTVVGRD
jgi:hypothetical protein